MGEMRDLATGYQWKKIPDNVRSAMLKADSRLAAALDLIESLVEAEKRGDARYSRNPADGEEAVVIDYDWWRAWQADAEKLVKEGGDG